MRITRSTLIIGTILIILLIIGAFGLWYLYISQAQKSLDAQTSGRGLESSLGGFPVGSAYNNIAQTIGGFFSGGDTTSTAQAAGAAPRLWQAGSAPAAGIAWVNKNGMPTLRFVDAASGNIFDALPNDSSVVRRSNTLKAGPGEASWSGTDGIILRTPTNVGIETFSGIIVKEASATSSLTASAASTLTSQNPGALSGTDLPRNIISIAGTQDSNTIAYVAPYNGGSAVYTADRSGANTKRIWESPLSEWHITWMGDSLLLTQKAGNAAPGYAYSLSLSGVATIRIANVPGLTTVGNISGDILYGSALDNDVQLAGIASSKSDLITPPFKTLPEKCVWGSVNTSVVYCAVPKTLPDATMPDSWYRGEVSTSDSIWRFDTKTGAVSNVYDPAQDNTTLDILDMTVDDTESYLGFRDATSRSVWVLRIKK